MDLSKFAALLQEQALVFARSDTLGDPFEGSAPEHTVREGEALIRFRAGLLESNPYPDLSDADIRKMHRMLSQIRKDSVRSTYISCWHVNDHESAAMWSLYSSSNDSVCIKTSYDLLGKSLPENCFLGLVNYVDFKTARFNDSNAFTPFMHKRLSFAHEREARAMLYDPPHLDENGQEIVSLPVRKVPVSLSALIECVYVNPNSPRWFFDVVRGLIEKYGLDARLRQSELSDPPLY